MSTLADEVKALKADLSIEYNPYFASLVDGSFSREDFIETQVQFLFAVVFFSRPMAVLAARLPRPEVRLTVLHNVYEEHGEGKLSLSHERTFLELLDRLGVDRSGIDERALWPEVRAFNAVLAATCTHDDVPTAVATLGIIEDLFSGISSMIGEAIVARGWLEPDQIVHYATHKTLDEEHADEFYDIIRDYYESSARGRYQVKQGLELGAYVFLKMYRDLYESRQRRATRGVRGTHSLAEGWFVREDF
jgi:pyrroloquinoline quinone (PQQ) biosynthesis protein C